MMAGSVIVFLGFIIGIIIGFVLGFIVKGLN